MNQARSAANSASIGAVSWAHLVVALLGWSAGSAQAQALIETDPPAISVPGSTSQNQVTLQDEMASARWEIYQPLANEQFAEDLIGADVYAPAVRAQEQGQFHERASGQQQTFRERQVTQEELRQMENIGSVSDVVIDEQGMVRAVVLDLGGFLGMGGHQVALSIEHIELGRDQGDPDRIVIFSSAGVDEWESAPEFDRTHVFEPAATRLFGGPEDFPPEDFAAYAILASWTQPSQERERFIAICMAYATILSRSDSVFVPPPDSQLVTVWPVDSVELAQELGGGGPDGERCAIAVDRYDLETARKAMRDAETGSPGLRPELAHREGPFLIAWNPSGDKGRPDIPIFRMDLSEARTQAQAEAFFRLWRQGILDNSENWLDSWHDPGVQLRLRLFLENNAENATAAIASAARAMGIVRPGNQ